MNTRRSFLASLSGVPFLLADAGCIGQTPAQILSEAEGGVNDAGIALQAIAAAVDGYFVSKPNPTLQAKIDAVLGDAATALRALDAAFVGATSIADGNVQVALAAFGTAYAAVMTLVAEIGIQTAPKGVTAGIKGPNGIVYIPAPRILSKLVKPATK